METTQTAGTMFGTLRNYRTGEAIRPATEREYLASLEAAQRDGGAGVIRVNIGTEYGNTTVSCYVES